MSQYPMRVTGSAGGHAFERRPDLYAVRQPAADVDESEAVAVIPEDAATTIAVYPKHRAARRGEQPLPVYAASPGGPLAVPTGRIFVRLPEGARADERRAQFEEAGFVIDQTMSYAPNAAWLRPSGGEHALQALDRLRGLADVVHVEPQWLMARALKGN